MTAQIVMVRPDRVDLCWPTVEPWLDKAIGGALRLYDTGDVRLGISEERMALWVAIVDEKVIGFAVTSVEKYPRMTLMVVRWCGGEIGRGREWLGAMVAELEKWAREWGCAELTGGGRPGWLRNLGFEEHGVMMRKRL